jgi:nitrite reductase/ring-hydroxylating ferredoxin subunit
VIFVTFSVLAELNRLRYKGGMPILKRGGSGRPEEFVTTVPAGHVREGEMTAARVHGRKIILTRYEGQLYAIDSLCPHAAADLGHGSLHRWRLCCHEHDYCFDVRTGRIVWPEDEVYRLRRYEVKEEDGVVKVRLSLI